MSFLIHWDVSFIALLFVLPLEMVRLLASDNGLERLLTQWAKCLKKIGHRRYSPRLDHMWTAIRPAVFGGYRSSQVAGLV